MGLRGPKKGSKRKGGRQKGTLNKRTEATIATAAKYGDPVETLIRVSQGLNPDTGEPDQTITLQTRLDAAKAAANYVRPKLQSIEHRGEFGINVGALSDQQLEDLIRLLRIARGDSTS